MRTFKRNAVIITVVLFVCAAAYLNWSYNKQGGETDTIAEPTAETAQTPSTAGGQDANSADAPESGLYYTKESGTADNSDFFAATRISRRQARDAAAETLATVSSNESASQEVIDAALDKITSIASVSTKEAELESLIMAKGFSDCVVFISDEGVKVTVPAPSEGLSKTAVAQITDVITSETEYKAVDLDIIEVK